MVECMLIERNLKLPGNCCCELPTYMCFLWHLLIVPQVSNMVLTPWKMQPRFNLVTWQNLGWQFLAEFVNNTAFLMSCIPVMIQLNFQLQMYITWCIYPTCIWGLTVSPVLNIIYVLYGTPMSSKNFIFIFIAAYHLSEIYRFGCTLWPIPVLATE